MANREHNENKVHVRLYLSPDEVKQFERIQRFLGVRSLSQAVARCAVWNASLLSAALDSSGQDSARMAGALQPMVDEFTAAAVRSLCLGGVAGHSKA